VFVEMELWNKDTLEATFEAEFSPATIEVRNARSKDGLDKRMELQGFLELRAMLPCDYDFDEFGLKTIGLYDVRAQFGRVAEECPILYALVTYFRKEGDGYAVYPKRNFALCFSAFDTKYRKVYDIRSRRYAFDV